MENNQKIIVLGSSGMLGKYVVKHLKSVGKEVISVTRKDFDVANVSPGFLDGDNFILNPGDVVVNCAGIIKPQVALYGEAHCIKVNSIFPYLLEKECKKLGLHAIHISTDCVYNGTNAPTTGYTEMSPHNAEDVYGKSKSLGEAPKLTTIRTSIIGEEVGQARSLIEWVKSKKGGEASGFINHFWNGITCLQLAKVINQMIDKNLFWKGPRHIFNKKSVSKDDLLRLINDAFELGITINKSYGNGVCDRTLGTVHIDTDEILCAIPDYETQLKELKEFKVGEA